MTKKEQILKAVIELAITEGRLEELKRAKLYMNNPTYVNNRRRVLEDNSPEIKITLLVPESLRKSISVPEDIIQYLKREHLEIN
jgi:hypothetical protein